MKIPGGAWTLLLTLAIILSPREGSAQVLADFESPAASPPFTSEGAAMVIANPDRSGINPSDSAGFYEKLDGNWHFVNLHFPDTVRIRYNNTLTFKLRTSTQGRIFAKFYDGPGVVIENWCPAWSFQPAPNTWVECTMDMTAAMGRQFTVLQLAACVDNTAAADVWFDDVRLSNPQAGDGTPVLQFSVSKSNPIVGQEVTLDASASYDFDGEIVDYLWDLGDGDTAQGAMVSHTYAFDSVFTVTLTLVDNDGKQAHGKETLFVIDPARGISHPLFTTGRPEIHRKIEAVFQLSGSYDNVYDPDEVRVDAAIRFPAGDSILMPCFFHVPVGLEEGERQADPSRQSWMLRFTTPYEGPHEVRLILQDSQGTRYSESTPVSVSGGSRPGFIKRDPDNGQYFRRTTGEAFYPLGINIGWSSLEEYRTILENLSSRGANTFRYWLTPFAWQALEWDESYYYNYEGLGRYNQEAAAMADSILELCDSLGMHMQMTLFQHGPFSENVDEMWDSNPYNLANGGYVSRAEEYFYSDPCRVQTKKLLRYVVARWSYSTRIFAWEFFNEVQFTGLHNSQSDLWWPGVLGWHSEMSRYLASLDPFGHLQATSAANHQLASLDTIATLGNLQYHLYDDEETMLNEQIMLDRRFQAELGHASVINGEYGTSNGADTPSDMQRHALWNGIMTQVPRYMWVWEHYLNPAWAGLFTPPARYLEGEELSRLTGPERYDFTVSHASKSLESLGISGDTAFYGYIYDPANGRNITGATATLDGLPVAVYRFECFDAITGDLILSDTLGLIRGTHNLGLPLFSKGIAFKLKYLSAYDLPLAQAGRDTTVKVGTPAYLSGASSSSPGGEIESYQWTLVEKPEGSQSVLDDSSCVEPSVTPDIPGSYRLSLVVSDLNNISEPDEVTVRGTLPPVAIAGLDSTVDIREDYVRLDGSASYDPDGDVLYYSWELVSAPAESQGLIYEEDTYMVILRTDAEGVFTLTLTVSDGTCESEPDTAVVTVTGTATGLYERGDGGWVMTYPNPSSGVLYIIPSGEGGISQVEVLDLKGRLLLRLAPNGAPHEPVKINLEPYLRESQLLLLRWQEGNGTFCRKIHFQKQ